MPYSEEEKKANHMKMFGESVESLKDVMENHMYDGSPNEVLMYAMGILSDAQHVMAGGDDELARKFINKAKWYMGEVMSDLRKGE